MPHAAHQLPVRALCSAPMLLLCSYTLAVPMHAPMVVFVTFCDFAVIRDSRARAGAPRWLRGGPVCMRMVLAVKGYTLSARCWGQRSGSSSIVPHAAHQLPAPALCSAPMLLLCSYTLAVPMHAPMVVFVTLAAISP